MTDKDKIIFYLKGTDKDTQFYDACMIALRALEKLEFIEKNKQ